MKSYQKVIYAVFGALLLLVLGVVIYTRDWANDHNRIRALRASKHAAQAVDTRALDTAVQSATLAVTRSEQEFSHQAVELADRSLDLAFAAAIEDARENPAPPTPETRQLTTRIKAAEDRVAADQDRVDQLDEQLARARASAKDAIQEQIDGANAQLTLDQDELDDAHEDLVRAGGDRHTAIQRLLDQHKASERSVDAHPPAAATPAATPAPAAAASAASPAPSIEVTKSTSILAQAQAWLSLNAKMKSLRAAQESATARAADLSGEHESLEKELKEEKEQKKILHKGPKAASQTGTAPGATETVAPLSPVQVLKQLALDQKRLSQLDERIECEQQLAAVYGSWITNVTARKQAFLHGILLAIFWILLIALVVLIANDLIQRFFADLSPERRQLHTARAATLLGVQILGIILILLVIFGQPGNFATVLALAGAGLTVAMKDFIVGFLGWFILMGKDGIRPGDWVEINGVGGEVLEVGPLHTVLLETGSWLDAAHPTGRKVTFVNSFAIEGHYFNFSTSGQWLWDELQVQVPQPADPYMIAEAIQKIVMQETEANARLAEQEWQRVTPAFTQRSFNAAPSMSVRPVAAGEVNILIRYLTRANERQETRARLYRAAVELLHKKNVPQSHTAPTQPSAKSVSKLT